MFIKIQDLKSINNIARFFEKQNVFLLITLLLCIGIFTFQDYLFFKKLYIFLDIGNDTYNQAYPNFVNISDYIRTEGIPAWSFYQGMGQNIFPGGISNPFNLILYLLGQEYIPFGIAYLELLKMILGGVIFYFYLRTLSLSPYTCVIGGILFAFSGYMVLGSGWYGHSTFIVSGIFFIYSFEKLFKQNNWFYFPLSVVFIVSCTAFYLYILGIFLFIYSVFRLLDEGRWSIKEVCILYLKLVGFGALGLAMVAPFVANDFLRMLESPRVGGDAGYFNKLMSEPIFAFGRYKHNITAVLRLFSNDILGVGSEFKGWYNYLEAPAFYCGLSTLLLFPQIFCSLNKKRKILYLLFFSIWTCMVVFPFFRYAFYLFTGNYYKGGISFIIPFLLLFYGLHALHFIYSNRKINRVLLLSSLGVLLCLLYFPYFPEDTDPVKDNIRLLITGFLICYSLIFLIYEKSENLKIIHFSLLIIMCIEAYMFSYITTNARYVLKAEDLKKSVGYNDETVKVIEYIKSKDSDFFRIEKNYYSGRSSFISLNDAQIQNYYGTPSYYQWNQKYYIRFLVETGIIEEHKELITRWAPGLTSRPLLQTLASVKYYLSKKKCPEFYKQTYKPFVGYKNIMAMKNKYFLPLGFTYNKYIQYDTFKKLNKNQKERILFKAFIIEKDKELYKDFELFDINSLKNEYSLKKYREDVSNLKRESMIIEEHSQNTIVGHIEVKKKKLLFLSIPYDKGWDIKIDGVKQKVELINIGFIGVVVHAGIHEIELSFKPPFLASGGLVMILSFVVYFLLILKKRISNRSR